MCTLQGGLTLEVGFLLKQKETEFQHRMKVLSPPVRANLD